MSKANWGRLEDIETLDASALAPGVVKRNVFWTKNGWDDYCARYFILPEGESIPEHSHDWDHFLISIGGHGEVDAEGDHYDLPQGSWARVPRGVRHIFRNIGDGDFSFICIVPTHGDPHAKKFQMRAERKNKKGNSSEGAE
ncbi:MAG: cupin domain-containing protein [Synergistaceae bacterium]|jgi:quercetin dioxygenase-like cupin family protein|nr:cupin domain-containing protein [Synergistaceae bacterium]